MQATHARQCGHVRRYHTTPTAQGGQCVAAHTWQVMRIWWQCFGPMSRQVSTYLLFHDAGEVGTGDLPHHVKRDVPALRPLLAEAEVETLVRLVPLAYAGEHELTRRDLLRAKACDMLDVIEFCDDERDMGNARWEALAADARLKLGETLRGLWGDYEEDHRAIHRYQEEYLEARAWRNAR